MAPRKAAAKSGKRSRTTSVSSTSGAVTRGGSRRSKTPAVQPQSGAPLSSTEQSHAPSSNEQKSHTGRALRSRTKGGDASPLRTGLEETTVRRSNRRTVSPALQPEPVTAQDELDVTEEDLEDLAQQQLLAEATVAPEISHSDTDVAVVDFSGDTGQEDVRETIEADVEIIDVTELVQVTQNAQGQSPSSEVEVTELTTSVIEIEDDVPVEIPQAMPVASVDVSDAPAEVIDVEVADELEVYEEPEEIAEPAENDALAAAEERSEATESPVSQSETKLEEPALIETTSSPQASARARRESDAMSPGPEPDAGLRFVDIIDGNQTFLQVPIRNALLFYQQALRETREERDSYFYQLLKLQQDHDALNARIQAQPLTALGPVGQNAAQPSAAVTPPAIAEDDVDDNLPSEHVALEMPPEYAAYLKPKPVIDFAAKILKEQENDLYGRANKAKDRARAVEKKEKGLPLSNEEKAIVMEFEAEQKAAQLEKSLSETPGSFDSTDKTDIVAESSQHTSTPRGGGFTARIARGVQYFSPSRILGGWVGSASHAKARSSEHEAPVTNGRKRKAEDDPASPLASASKRNASRTPCTDQRQPRDTGFESPTEDPVMDSPSVKRQRLDRGQPQRYPSALQGFEPNLTPVSERSNESSILHTLQTPHASLPQATPRTGDRRMSVRSARRANQQIKTPLSQAKRDFIAQSSSMRKSARDQALEQEEQEVNHRASSLSDSAASTADEPAYMSAQTGQKRKTFVARDAPIPQVRPGYGFDYDDYEFEEDEDTTMMDVAEAEPDRTLQDQLARVYEEYKKLPVSVQQDRPSTYTDEQWLKKMQIHITMHGPVNQKLGSRFTSGGSRSPAPVERNPRATLTPVAPSKRLTAQEQQILDRDGVLPGTPATGRTFGVPVFDEDSPPAATSTPIQEPEGVAPPAAAPLSASAPAATTTTASSGSAATSIPAQATPRRAAHEQYKPRQPSRLREETTARETSESEGEPQPPTPTNDEVSFQMFRNFMSIAPGPKLQVSPKFAEAMTQPGWEQGAANLIDTLNLPMSMSNCGV